MSTADYPRMMFHRKHQPVTVYSEEQEASLGAGWSRTIPQPEGEPAPSPDIPEPAEPEEEPARPVEEPAEEVPATRKWLGRPKKKTPAAGKRRA